MTTPDMRQIKTIVLVVPKNDPESLLITQLAEAFHIPTVISDQPHGARLEREADLRGRIHAVNPQAKTLVIVEIPGPVIEEELGAAGYHVVIIDHHRYDGLDRMQPRASLEQFLAYFEIDDEALLDNGFDFMLVRGVAAIDRGFIWELQADGYSAEDQHRIRTYFRDLSLRVGGEWKEEEAEAWRAWHMKRDVDGVFIVETKRTDISLRAALSFILADEIGQPHPMLIRQGDWRVYFQDSDKAKYLYEAFGGFTFGKDRCWGFSAEEGRPLPSNDAILEVVRSA